MRSTIHAQKIIIIALLSILIQLNSFVTKKRFLAPQPKNPGYGTGFNRLLSLELNILMTPTLFERLVQKFPNIERLSFNYNRVICEHQNNDQNCFQCNDRVFKSISKLNRLKVLKIIEINFEKLKAFENNINK
jgi:hypothetical protein